jgi:hypothetical protein
MPLISITQPILSDLVLHEQEPALGYARRVVNVTTTVAMPMGTVVFRVKDPVDQTSPYAPLTAPTTQLVAANEFAVVFGDKFGMKEVVEPAAAGDTPAVTFIRGEVQLKDQLLLSVNAITRDSAEHLALKALLEAQGVIIETTLGA